jgi:hypothetical protein
MFFQKCLHSVYAILQTTPNLKLELMIKLTNSFVSTLPFPDKGQVFYRDSSLTGFGLRITPSKRTYIVEARVNGIVRRISVGDQAKMAATVARSKALKLLSQMAAGEDPIAEKAKKKIVGVTLREILQHYLLVRNLRPN